MTLMYASEPMTNPHRNVLPIYMCSQLKKREGRRPEWCIPAYPKRFGGVPSTYCCKEYRALPIPEKHWNAQAVSEQQHKDQGIWGSETRTSNRRTRICRWTSWDICVFMCDSHCSSKMGTSLDVFKGVFRPSLFFGDRLVVGAMTESARPSVLDCILCVKGGARCSDVVCGGDPLRGWVKLNNIVIHPTLYCKIINSDSPTSWTDAEKWFPLASSTESI